MFYVMFLEVDPCDRISHSLQSRIADSVRYTAMHAMHKEFI